MMVFSYSRTMAGAQRIAQQRGRPLPTIEAQQPERPPVVTPAAMAPPVKPAAGLSIRNAVVLKFTPRTAAQKIIADIAHNHGLTYADLMRRNRKRRIVMVRDEAMAAVKSAKPCLSLPQLGRLFADRDHTTILSALRRHAKRATA
ncbi:hypothetical protein NKI61_19900 [Mesorhizobium sp. M0514]|uniref:helix-turn-helix domain-containing protein n=1 Tax=Mesorhizobium sp. M0514 TaxID=2956955 RepID=UPI00333641A5